MKKTLLFSLCCMTVISSFLTLPQLTGVEAYDSLIPVSSGDSITIYEETVGVHIHNFSVSVLMGIGGNFKGAQLENYTATSDGTYLKIHCFRDRFLSGHAVGNNIVAVMLNGVLGFPDGLWASVIVNHTLGHNGIAESRFNALGSDTQIGPYAPASEYGLCTYMGDQHSELVLGFTPTSPVGGIIIQVDKLELLAPYIGLTILLAVAFITLVYVKKRKRHTEINF